MKFNSISRATDSSTDGNSLYLTDGKENSLEYSAPPVRYLVVAIVITHTTLPSTKLILFSIIEVYYKCP